MSLVAIFCGDREWTDAAKIKAKLIELDPCLVIEGEAPGADKLSRELCEAMGIKFEPFPAAWAIYGRAAGPLRNKVMLDRLLWYREQGYEVAVIAFHSNLNESKGTKNMVNMAKAFEIIPEVIK